MSVFDELITDRTVNDVYRWKELRNLIINRVIIPQLMVWNNVDYLSETWNDIDSKELPWGEVFETSQSEWTEWLFGVRGAYGASDMNRVGMAMASIAAALGVAVSPKMDWVLADIPSTEQMFEYLNNIKQCVDMVVALEPTFGVELPVSMENLTHDGANQIEQALYDMNVFIGGIATWVDVDALSETWAVLDDKTLAWNNYFSKQGG